MLKESKEKCPICDGKGICKSIKLGTLSCINCIGLGYITTRTEAEPEPMPYICLVTESNKTFIRIAHPNQPVLDFRLNFMDAIRLLDSISSSIRAETMRMAQELNQRRVQEAHIEAKTK